MSHGYELNNLIERMIQERVNTHPMVLSLMNRIETLEDRLLQMERCCVCVKINKPAPEKVE